MENTWNSSEPSQEQQVGKNNSSQTSSRSQNENEQNKSVRSEYFFTALFKLFYSSCCCFLLLQATGRKKPDAQRGSPDLVDRLDELHGGKRFPRSIVNCCQDLLFSLVPVADVVADLGASILNYRPMSCSGISRNRWRAPIQACAVTVYQINRHFDNILPKGFTKWIN